MNVKSKTKSRVAFQVNITDAEINQILSNAQASNDPYTIASARRALRGDIVDRLACAMILGR